MYKIKYTDVENNEFTMLSEAEHSKYEYEHNVPCNYKKLFFYAEINNEIIGVLSSYTCWQEIYIEDIVIKEEYRNQGIGKRLIDSLEEFFRDKGYHNISLVTHAFQAPKFYEKCGFMLEFVRKNKNNPKLDKYFYSKYM